MDQVDVNINISGAVGENGEQDMVSEIYMGRDRSKSSEFIIIGQDW